MARFLPLDGMKMQIVRNEIEGGEGGGKPRSLANDIVAFLLMLDFAPFYIAKNEKRGNGTRTQIYRRTKKYIYMYVEGNYAERICGRGSSLRVRAVPDNSISS